MSSPNRPRHVLRTSEMVTRSEYDNRQYGVREVRNTPSSYVHQLSRRVQSDKKGGRTLNLVANIPHVVLPKEEPVDDEFGYVPPTVEDNIEGEASGDRGDDVKYEIVKTELIDEESAGITKVFVYVPAVDDEIVDDLDEFPHMKFDQPVAFMHDDQIDTETSTYLAADGALGEATELVGEENKGLPVDVDAITRSGIKGIKTDMSTTP